MKVTLSYSNILAGTSFTPLVLLMFARELRECGVEVRFERNPPSARFRALPSDNPLSEKYSEALSLVETLRGERFDAARRLQVDYDINPGSDDITGVITAFGCPYHNCRHCMHAGLLYERRPLAQVLSELSWVTRRHDYFEFYDTDVMADQPRFLEVTEVIPAGKTWGALLHVDEYSDEALQSLYERGCRNLYVGIESFNDLDLRYYRKRYYLQGIDPRHFLLRLRGVGFSPMAFMIRGFPNEKPGELDDALSWMDANGIYSFVSRFCATPGGEVRETHNLSRAYLNDAGKRDNARTVANLAQMLSHPSPFAREGRRA